MKLGSSLASAPRPSTALLRPLPACIAAALAIGGPAAWGQQRSVTITPSFSATQEFTDNRSLSATDRQAEAITVLTPRVTLSSRSGRVQGSIDYALSAVLYARDSSANSLQNTLAARFGAEVIENRGYLDGGASISRQSISALDLQGNRPNAVNPNSTEVRSLSLSPSLRGRLFGDVDVQARLTSSFSSSADNSASDAVSHNASLSVGESVGAMGWSVVANRGISDFEAGRRTTQDRLSARVSYAPDPSLRFFVTAGTERNDVQTTDQRANDTWGGGVSWQPTPRTQFGLQGERRYFGNSHSLSFSHRMRRAVVSYSDSRSVLESTAGVGTTLSTYDLFFAQFASLEPDPVLRDVLVRNFLRAAGLDPDQRLNGGFLNTALTVQRSINLSLALQGRRNSLVLSTFATESRRADTVSNAQDDLSQVSVLLQQGWNLSLSHRLTATSSVVLTAAQQRTRSSNGVPGNGLNSLSLSWAGQVSQRSSLSVTARHAQANGANPYRESALSATYSLGF